MAARFVTFDHDTPLLLPPDMRDWVTEEHMVHFVMDAVRLLKLEAARVNHRGTGDAQYPPSLMLGLLIYCYATGTLPRCASPCGQPRLAVSLQSAQQPQDRAPHA